jgi:hypothetical protein
MKFTQIVISLLIVGVFRSQASDSLAAGDISHQMFWGKGKGIFIKFRKYLQLFLIEKKRHNETKFILSELFFLSYSASNQNRVFILKHRFSNDLF